MSYIYKIRAERVLISHSGSISSSIFFNSGSHVSASLFSGSFYGDGSNLTGIAGGIFTQTGSFYATSNNLQITGGLAITNNVFANNASITNTISASNLYASNTVTAPGGLIGTSSWATNALTASFLLGSVISASYAATASFLLGSVTSASYAATSSYAQGLFVSESGDLAGFNYIVFVSGSPPPSENIATKPLYNDGLYYIPASNTLVATNFSGTATNANNATSASYAATASLLLGSVTSASYAATATSASVATTSTSASYASTASRASYTVPRTTSVASSASPTPNVDITDQYILTALAVTATFGAPTGTPVEGQKLIIRITDNGTPRTLNWNAIYRTGSSVGLPADTSGSTLYAGFIYNDTDTTWDIVALSEGY